MQPTTIGDLTQQQRINFRNQYSGAIAAIMDDRKRAAIINQRAKEWAEIQAATRPTVT